MDYPFDMSFARLDPVTLHGAFSLMIIVLALSVLSCSQTEADVDERLKGNATLKNIWLKCVIKSHILLTIQIK